MFSGSIPALVTPFGPDGAFDEAAYRDLIEWQIAEGSSALVTCGTTGEAATLTAREHFDVVRACVGQANGRVPVIAGAGSNDTRVAAANLRAALVREFPDILVGLKDASGMLTRVAEHRASLGPDFVQLTGSDELWLASNASGGVGCISVTANVAPRLCALFQAACQAGDYAEALRQPMTPAGAASGAAVDAALVHAELV